MPYIIQDKRAVLDPAIDSVMLALRELECDGDESTNSMAGNINYLVTRILDRVYIQRYNDINEAMGILACISAEYYRRVAGPYENQKAFDNGDVYDFSPAL